MHSKNVQGIVVVKEEFNLSRKVADSATQHAEEDSSGCVHFTSVIDHDPEM